MCFWYLYFCFLVGWFDSLANCWKIWAWVPWCATICCGYFPHCEARLPTETSEETWGSQGNVGPGGCEVLFDTRKNVEMRKFLDNEESWKVSILDRFVVHIEVHLNFLILINLQSHHYHLPMTFLISVGSRCFRLNVAAPKKVDEFSSETVFSQGWVGSYRRRDLLCVDGLYHSQPSCYV